MRGETGGNRRITENSLKTAVIPGTPSTSSGDPNSESDSHNQDSQSTDKVRNDNNGGDQTTDTNQNNGGEHPDNSTESRQTSFDHDPDEAAEWDKLMAENEQLQKSKQHANRKITEMGQNNSELTQANEQLTQENTQMGDRLGRVEGLLAQMLSRMGGEPDQSATARYGGDFGGDSTPSEDGLDEVVQDVDTLKRVLGGLYTSQEAQNEEFNSFKSEREFEQRVSNIQTEYGIDAETAETLIERFDSGDMVGFSRMLELSTMPAEARKSAREARQRQRNAVGHPSTNGSSFNPVDADEAAIKKRATDIMALPDGRNKQRQVESFMQEYPDSLGFLSEALGFRI